MNKLANCIQTTCCGTTCEKSEIVNRVSELENNTKHLQSTNDELLLENARLEEELVKQAEFAFKAGCTIAKYTNDNHREWLNYRVRVGL